MRLYASGHLPHDIEIRTDGKDKLNTNIQLLQERVVEKLSEWYPTALRENQDLKYPMKFHDDTVLMHHNFWRFLRALHERLDDDTPTYFGTAHGDEICCCGKW